MGRINPTFILQPHWCLDQIVTLGQLVPEVNQEVIFWPTGVSQPNLQLCYV